MSPPIPYADAVEVPEPDEARHIQRCIDSMFRTNAVTVPAEDAGVDRPQAQSPYRPVASIRCPPQGPYSPARRVFADDRLAFVLDAVQGTETTAAAELPD